MNPGQRRGRIRRIKENTGSINEKEEGGRLFWLRYYKKLEPEFERYLLEIRRISERTVREYLRGVPRVLTKIGRPKTLSELKESLLNMDLSLSQKKALRNYLNFLVDTEELSEEEARKIKKFLVLPSTTQHQDLWVPSDGTIQEWVRIVDEIPEAYGHYKDIFFTILYSGIRVSEAIKLLREFDRSRLKCEKNFCYYELNWTRGSKRNFVIFLPAHFAQNLKRRPDLSKDGVWSFFSKHRGIQLKYLRKWFINKAIESGAPYPVIKFLVGHSQGRDITALHYLDLLGQAKRNYPKILETIENALQNPDEKREEAAVEASYLSNFIEETLFEKHYSEIILPKAEVGPT